MNVLRRCLYCSLEDDHPKHETIHPGFVSAWAHITCCAEVLKCELCTPVAKAANGKRGEELREFILNGKG